MKTIEEVPKAGLDKVVTQCSPMKQCHSLHCALTFSIFLDKHASFTAVQ